MLPTLQAPPSIFGKPQPFSIATPRPFGSWLKLTRFQHAALEGSGGFLNTVSESGLMRANGIREKHLDNLPVGFALLW